MAFPHLPSEWPDLDEAQRASAELCRSIAGPGKEHVRLLVRDESVERVARSLIGEAQNVMYLRADYGDAWTRDTLPVFGHDVDGQLGALRFGFNGWGEKYEMPGDATVGDWVLARTGARAYRSSLILEGGAIESNGSGVLLTTESCALNPNRNPGLSRESFESSMQELLELERIVWLASGLAHDHTDGHVDMIARFVSSDTVVCMRPEGDVPNAELLRETRATLAEAGLRIVDLPAPGPVHAPDGAPLPASYCNFYVANAAVIVPSYGVPEDAAALARVAETFPTRQVIGLRASHLLCGGGAFHCVTQPQFATP
jgi:agmatine deiminase